MTDFRAITTKARELRGRVTDLDSVRPTPVVAAANMLGYAVKQFEPTRVTRDVSGAVNHDEKTIYVNAIEVPFRKRFTIAHEVGHVVLHPEANRVDYRGDIGYSPDQKARETEANAFASELLMPRHVFEALWHAHGGDVDAVAAQLEVSVQAATIQAKKLKLL